MKSLIPPALLCTTALFIVALKNSKEEPPKDALEKITSAMPTTAFAKPQKIRTILVFSKTNGFRHGSIPTGKIAFEKMGEISGAFKTVISDDLENFEAEKLAKFDAVCFLNTTGNAFSPHKDQLEKMSDDEKKVAKEREERLKDNLMKYIKSGAGFIGIHAATDTFQEWKEYGTMINGYFGGHPWNSKSKVSIKVEPGQESHPLVAMFKGKNLELIEEIYQLKNPYDSKSVHMLLRLDNEKTDMNVKGINRTDGDFGVAWARNWGKGRMFYCSIGHNDEMFWNPEILSHYLAGVQWAIGDYKVKVSH